MTKKTKKQMWIYCKKRKKVHTQLTKFGKCWTDDSNYPEYDDVWVQMENQK